MLPNEGLLKTLEDGEGGVYCGESCGRVGGGRGEVGKEVMEESEDVGWERHGRGGSSGGASWTKDCKNNAKPIAKLLGKRKE